MILAVWRIRNVANVPFCVLRAHTLIKTFLTTGKLSLNKSGECTLLLFIQFKDSLHLSRWLYALFLAIDANFRLKRRMVSKDSVDPGLSRGWAYFVDETEYKSYIHTLGSTPQEVSKSYWSFITLTSNFNSEALVHPTTQSAWLIPKPRRALQLRESGP